MSDLAGKRILVIAGCGGIGREITEHLSQRGALVIATSRDPETVRSQDATWTQAEETICARVLRFEADELPIGLGALIKEFGRIDGLVNAAAGRFPSKSVEDTTTDDIVEDIRASVGTAFECAAMLVRERQTTGICSIVNIGSIYGSLAVDHRIYSDPAKQTSVAYATAKGGLVQMTRYLAAYWGPYQIRVNVVSPGGIGRQQDTQFLERYNSRVPMGRMAKPSEVSGAVEFLMGDASAYITGTDLMVDGGLHAW